jgi:transposase
MANKRRQFSASEKVVILRRHLLDQVPVSDLCDELGLNPNVFYRWQKEFFEHGTAAFERRPDGRERKLKQKVEALTAKLTHKDSVIAEIMEAHVALKKRVGRSEGLLGGAGCTR